MEKKILKMIDQYQTIIIHRHTRPDMDAIGSQMGLYYVLKENYPHKQIYVVGDINDMSYKAIMDDIRDDTFTGALSIIVDVAVSKLVSDERYKLAKDLIVIDHHKNPTDLNPTLFYSKSNYTSACEVLVELIKKWKFVVNSEAATYLYGGMVTDTGRFLYINSKSASNVFKMASYITKFNPDITDFYDFLYTESIEKKQTKQMFASFELTKHKVAYRFNDQNIIDQSKLDIQSVSRGMVNQMSGIKEVYIWASFTEDKENNQILGEFRSRGLSIVDIAKKYGGGGHDQACGASLKSFEEAKLVLKDLDERAKAYAKNIK